MKMSVAMCTYNGEPYLRAQLESIAAQTRLPDELVICDDASSDDTRAIIEHYSAHSPFPVRLRVNEQNLGSTKNFEKAIGFCQHDIVVLSDQDDVWSAQKLACYEAVFASRPDVGLVFSDGEVVDEQLVSLGYSLWDRFEFTPTRRKLVRSGQALTALLKGNFVTGATVALRASFRPLILPIPDNGLLHDEWAALMIASMATLEFIDARLIRYRLHRQQQIGASSVARRATLEKALKDTRQGHLSRAQCYQQAYKRLLAVGNLQDGKIKRQWEAGIFHSQTRGSLPEKRRRRIPLILRELFSWRYTQYSRGMGSAVKDLWF